MTDFDTAWRKGEEDATAKTLQEAYDQGDGDFNRFQRWFHVAEPIEVLMPNSDKPQSMERTHIGTNRLADEKGEYVGAKQAMADYQEDLQNLSRKRKNPKDPKHARIFIPNPESKIDEIGDFHIDEAHSDDWQEKLAGEPMTAFDTAWTLLKSNFYYGTDDPDGSAGRWDSMRLDPHYDSKERDYYTGVNLSHPWYHGMNEEDTIRRIIDSIAHEEGHQAVFSPLKENREMEFEDEGYEPMYYSESNPPNTQQEYGAMLVEGMEHQGIMDELRRRRFFG